MRRAPFSRAPLSHGYPLFFAPRARQIPAAHTSSLTLNVVILNHHRESKTPNFIQSRFFENPTVIRSNFAQFAPNNVLKRINFGYFLGFSINYRIKSRSNAEKYPIMIRIVSNQVIGYFLERDWVFGRSIFTERIFFGVFGSLC